jgi:hypothetical protein
MPLQPLPHPAPTDARVHNSRRGSLTRNETCASVSEEGQSRRFDCVPATSALPKSTDIVRSARQSVSAQKQTVLLAQRDRRIDVISLCDANERALYR